MNEQTPRDPQQPIGANDPTPQHPVHDAAPAQGPADTAAHTVENPVPAPAGDAPKRGRGILKPVLIGAGAAVAVLAVAGIGIGVADAVDDANDGPQDQTGISAPQQTDGGSQGGGSGQGSDDGQGRGDDQGGQGPTAPAANGDAGSAESLSAAIDAAVAAVDGGEGATAVEVERDGWSVDVRLADGTEVDVRVPASGEPVVREDDDDRTSDALLDTSRIADIVDAAIAAAGGGTVQSIETEDDDSHAFDVQVQLGGDQDVDVELADDLTVVSVDD